MKPWLSTLAVAGCLSVTTLSTAATAQADSSPSGANNWSCRPTAAHPYPVVLVHGTGADAPMNWAALSPKLAGAGYCVYALDYGQTDASAGFSDALGEIGASAGTLSGYVDKVLAATGSHKVDIVGHSQGGMMPNYYVKRLGGAAKVDKLVGLAPSNHGTTSEGLTALASAIGDPGLVSTYHNLAQHPDLAAFGEQAADSPFQKSLWADGDTVPGVHYAVVETSHDEVVTPYTNAFLHGGDVTNILIQNQCPDDPVGHIGIAFDGPALQDVLNILGPDNPGFHPTCTDYGATL